MTDLISRTNAIEAWDKLSKRGRTEFDQVLMTLPSADVVSREDYHNLLMASNDITKSCVFPQKLVTVGDYPNDVISRNALMEYCSNQKSKTIDNNDIARFPSADAEWIPITTSEPTTSNHVLVTYNWGDDNYDDYEVSELDYWVTKCAAEEGNKQCQMFIDHVIAWSFMPQPYKER